MFFWKNPTKITIITITINRLADIAKQFIDIFSFYSIQVLVFPFSFHFMFFILFPIHGCAPIVHMKDTEPSGIEQFIDFTANAERQERIHLKLNMLDGHTDAKEMKTSR